MTAEIFVCQAGSCRREGSEAVLVEIEELANAVDEHCRVNPSGCLGLCNVAPGVMVVKRGDKNGNNANARGRRRRRLGEIIDQDDYSEDYFDRVASFDESSRVVTFATGKKPPSLEDSPQLQSKLAGVRALRVRKNAMSAYRWNAALKAVMEQISSFRHTGSIQDDLMEIYNDLVQKAGVSSTALLRSLTNTDPLSSPTKIQMPNKIEKYSLWTLEKVTPVSRHSAVFYFRSRDVKRGTPHPRGRNRPLPTPKTWHTTLLAETGGRPTREGPLPWIERDYTPISSAKEWERGTCAILIKIYNDGKATTWLHRIWRQHQHRIQAEEEETKSSNTTTTCDDDGGLRLWFSQPIQTLTVPALVPKSTTSAFPPQSILLLLAGTGVVALPQLLHHRDPYNKLGISTKRLSQLHVPIDVILSCRTDDVLMLPEIIGYCQQANDFETSNPQARVVKGVRYCTLLLTGENKNPPVTTDCPFPEADLSSQADQLTTLNALANARVVHSRLTPSLVANAFQTMSKPCRVVVSGPSGFNSAARKMLLGAANVDEDAITILEA